MAISTSLPADLTRLMETCFAIKREKQLEIYRRDSLLMQEGRAVERERMAAVAGHEHYEGGCDGDE
jgi:hypothetical protein